MRKLLYKHHPYRMMLEGEVDSLLGLKLSDLEEFIERLFVPNNSVISIAGEIEFDKVEEILRDSFGNWEKGELKVQIEYDKPPREKIYQEKKIPQKEVIIEFGFMVPPITTEARYYLDILQALVSGQGSLFFNRIRKGLGGAYTLGATMFLGPDPGLFSFYVATTPEKREEVIKVVQQILEDLREGKITEEELKDAKEMLRTKFYRDTLTNSSISFRLAIDELLGIGYDEIHDYLNRIEAITKDDLVEFIREYIDPNKAVLVEVGNI
jgi:predicted Zn-dependent peptidase